MMGTHIRLILLIIAGLGSTGAAISYFTRTSEIDLPGSQTVSNPAQGAVLYAEFCASCHGADLQGEPDWRSPKEDGTLPAPPHDETGHTWHHGDGLLFRYTKLGGQAALEATGVSEFTSGMPGFADQLSDQEIRDILAFIKSTWPGRIQEIQRQRTESETAAAGKGT